MMPARAENIDQDPENGTQSMLHSNLYAQPWWHGARNSTSVGNGDGSHGREDTHAKNILTSITPSTGDHLALTSSRELFGHSIVLTSSLCSDPRYGGPVTNYGPQAMVPHFYGIHHGRMPLPLEVAEEPVYVNAKQYHGILRRRRVRAKAELEKKVIKGRKPYLHESRHRHAMRRPRGSGGRFLNTKKLESKVSNLSLGKASNACVELSTQSANSTTSQSSPSSIARADSTGHMLKFCTSSNGNDSVYGFSSAHDLDAVECKDISYLGVPKETLQLYEAPNGAYNK